jgi:hypothetical protein
LRDDEAALGGVGRLEVFGAEYGGRRDDGEEGKE